jgi:rod shape-determining protein MreC
LYLPSKFYRPRYSIPFLIIFIISFYLLTGGFFRGVLYYFLNNFTFIQTKNKAQVQKLRSENIKLHLKLKKFRKLEQQNQSLQKALDFKKSKRVNIEPFKVVGIEPSQFRKVILINGGSDDALRKNMFVLNQEGYLIGKVSEVFKQHSEVILINDSHFSVTVKISDNIGLLKGTLSGRLEVFYIQEAQTIEKGQLVQAVSYYSGASFEVGQVEEIKKEPDSFFDKITVKPFYSSYPSEVVFVIK